MGYNIIDIIDKGIVIANKRKSILEKVVKENTDMSSLDVVSKALIKGIDKNIQYYETLKKEAGDTEFEEIDFVTYDKISFLISEFTKKICVPEIKNVRDYLRFSLELERDVYSLLVDIQGRFVKSTSDIHTKTYKILSDIIDNKRKRIEILQKTLH